jgi:hypothetical protein
VIRFSFLIKIKNKNASIKHLVYANSLLGIKQRCTLNRGLFIKFTTKKDGSSVLWVEGQNFIKIKSSTCGKFQTC